MQGLGNLLQYWHEGQHGVTHRNVSDFVEWTVAAVFLFLFVIYELWVTWDKLYIGYRWAFLEDYCLQLELLDGRMKCLAEVC